MNTDPATFVCSKVRVAIAMLLGICGALAAEPQGGATTVPAEAAAGPVATYQCDPKYVPPVPQVRGKGHRPPGGVVNVERYQIIWGWRLALPDGGGLGFGGLSPRTDDLATLGATSFKAEGTEHIDALTKGGKQYTWNLREIAWHPGMDLIIFDSLLPGGYMPALDPVKNRWVGVKVAGDFTHSHQSGFAYDQKRDLFYVADAHANVFALRLDPKVAVIKAFAEIVAEMPTSPAAP